MQCNTAGHGADDRPCNADKFWLPQKHAVENMLALITAFSPGEQENR